MVRILGPLGLVDEIMRGASSSPKGVDPGQGQLQS
jgi:hypothetical protein